MGFSHNYASHGLAICLCQLLVLLLHLSEAQDFIAWYGDAYFDVKDAGSKDIVSSKIHGKHLK